MSLTAKSLSDYILKEFEGMNCINTWGETSFFYNSNNKLPRGVYFCTLKEKDGDNDKDSKIDRAGVYRFNFGLPEKQFVGEFGEKPKRPAKGAVIEGAWDFTILDRLMPHPIYGWMGWVAILNPTHESFSEIKPLLKLAYLEAIKGFEKRTK
ncbi:MAG: DUF6194 family protein [Hellea sp.]